MGGTAPTVTVRDIYTATANASIGPTPHSCPWLLHLLLCTSALQRSNDGSVGITVERCCPISLSFTPVMLARIGVGCGVVALVTIIGACVFLVPQKRTPGSNSWSACPAPAPVLSSAISFSEAVFEPPFFFATQNVYTRV